MDKVNQKMKKFNLRGVLDGIRSSVSTQPKAELSIEESLRSEHFQLAKTVCHGFPYQPTAMAFDAVQNLLAIGTKSGRVRIFGRPGVDCQIHHDDGCAIIQILFLVNEGALVTVGDNDTVYLWTLRQKYPEIVHSLKFQRERITCCHLPFQSKWLYIGSKNGNVHVINIELFTLSGYIINWNKAIELTRKTHPGAVVHLSDCPSDPNKLLIGFESGAVVLWDLKSKTADSRYNCSEPLRSVSWHHEGKQIMCCHTDGSLTIWNLRIPLKPQHILMPHAKLGKDGKPEPCKSITKVEWKSVRNSEPYIIFSGGMPIDRVDQSPSLTVMHAKSTTVLEMEHSVVDFLTLCSTPWKNDFQDPYGIVVLLRNDLVVVDLTSPGYPCFENPYPMDIHESPVTACYYLADCPTDLIPAFYSVGSKQKKSGYSERDWPVKGGEWGTPTCSYPEVMITGHADGSVKFWDASAVTLQVLYKLKTAKMFDKNKCCRPDADDDPFAIQMMHLCPESRLFCVAGLTHVIVFRYYKQEGSVECPSLDVSIVYEIYDELDSPSVEYPPLPPKPSIGSTHQSGSVGSYTSVTSDGKDKQSSVTVKGGSRKWSPGYQPELCVILSWMDGEPAPPISSISLNSSYGLMAFGNECGIAIVDVVQKTCLLNMGTPDLYGSMDPYSRAPRSPKNKSQGRPQGLDGLSQSYTTDESKSPTQEQKEPDFILSMQITSPLETIQEGHSFSNTKASKESVLPVLRTEVIEGQESCDQSHSDLEVELAKEAVDESTFVFVTDVSNQTMNNNSATKEQKNTQHQNTGQTLLSLSAKCEKKLSDQSITLDTQKSQISKQNGKSKIDQTGKETATKNTDQSSFNVGSHSRSDATDSEQTDHTITVDNSQSASCSGHYATEVIECEKMSAEATKVADNINVGSDAQLESMNTGSESQQAPVHLEPSDRNYCLPSDKPEHMKKWRRSSLMQKLMRKKDHEVEKPLPPPEPLKLVRAVSEYGHRESHTTVSQQRHKSNPDLINASDYTDQTDDKPEEPCHEENKMKNFVRRVTYKIKHSVSKPEDHQWTRRKSRKFEVIDLTSEDVPTKPPCKKISYKDVIHMDKSDGSFSRSRSSSMSSLENVSKESIQCLNFADAYTRKTDSYTSPCLWVGTILGSVLVISINLPDEVDRKTQPVIVSPSGTIFRLKGSILTMSFLDCKGILIPQVAEQWRDFVKEESRESKKYNRQQSVASLKSRMSPNSPQEATMQDHQLAILCSEKQARVISLPSQTCAYKVKITDTSMVAKAEVITIKDSVCMGCYVANGHVIILSLPSLKPLLDVDHLPMADVRVAKTFCFSNCGHALYFCSPTEVQKITFSADVCDNLKDMLGELFLPTEAPEEPKQNFLKTLFTGGPATLDRQELFGEGSGKASKGVAKYSAGMGQTQEKLGAATSEIGRAKMAAIERGQHLSELEETTGRMRNEAESYSQHAHQLMQKYRDKKWYQF